MEEPGLAALAAEADGSPVLRTFLNHAWRRMKLKRPLLAVLCVAAIFQMWTFDMDPAVRPGDGAGTGALANLMVAMGFQMKTFIAIPLTYGFVIAAVQLLWRDKD
jgi:hypothetical protein